MAKMKKMVIVTLKIFQFVFLFSFVVNLTKAQDLKQGDEKVEWERIKLLVTKKAEIEDHFGKPISEIGRFITYNTKSGKLMLSYYRVYDPEKSAYNCSVSPDTVLDYTILLNKPILISKLGFDLNKFDKTPGDDGMYRYTSSKKGISFSVQELEGGQEQVSSIEYRPSSTDMKGKCVQDTN